MQWKIDNLHRSQKLSYASDVMHQVALTESFQARDFGCPKLEPVYDCFEEGIETTDLKEAKALLVSLE